ncbi:MAG: pyridoxamine 5'-phosphate oxidase family protein [Nakamurella sp.]
MPSAPLPPHIVEFLRGPNPAVIASNRPDGQPVSVATWYLLEDDRHILVNMDAGRKRLNYLKQDPRVSLTVLGKDWYQHVSMQGSLVLTPDPDMAGIDRISTHYTGHAYPDRKNLRVDGLITIESWHGWHLEA